MNTENNKIIAEFIGRHGKANKLLYAFKNLDYCGQIWFNASELRFHKDWNWLMGVVDKISKLPTDDGLDTFYPRTFGMLTDDGENMFRFNRHSLFKANTLMKAAYAACVDFIKWYNQQNSNDGKLS